MAEFRETNIYYYNDEPQASILTGEQSMKNHLDDLCNEFPNTFKLTKIDEPNNTYWIADKNLITIRRPSKPKPPLSDEERARLALNLAKGRETRKANLAAKRNQSDNV